MTVERGFGEWDVQDHRCYFKEVRQCLDILYFQDKSGKELPFIIVGGIWGAVIGEMARDLLHLKFYFFKK